MKPLTRILGAGTLALSGLTGCNYIAQRGVFEGYPVEYKESRGNKDTFVTIYQNEFMNHSKIDFIDIFSDGRLDRIDLTNIGKENPLGKLACFEVGQKLVGDFFISNQAFKEGKKVKVKIKYLKDGKE